MKSYEFSKVLRDYQKLVATHVVKENAKGEAARSTKAHEEGSGSAAGRP